MSAEKSNIVDLMALTAAKLEDHRENLRIRTILRLTYAKLENELLRHMEGPGNQHNDVENKTRSKEKSSSKTSEDIGESSSGTHSPKRQVVKGNPNENEPEVIPGLSEIKGHHERSKYTAERSREYASSKDLDTSNRKRSEAVSSKNARQKDGVLEREPEEITRLNVIECHHESVEDTAMRSREYTLPWHLEDTSKRKQGEKIHSKTTRKQDGVSENESEEITKVHQTRSQVSVINGDHKRVEDAEKISRESTLPWHLEDAGKRKPGKTIHSKTTRKQDGVSENEPDEITKVYQTRSQVSVIKGDHKRVEDAEKISRESSLPWHLEDTSKRKQGKKIHSKTTRKQDGISENESEEITKVHQTRSQVSVINGDHKRVEDAEKISRESTLPWHLEDAGKRKQGKTIHSKTTRKQDGVSENEPDEITKVYQTRSQVSVIKGDHKRVEDSEKISRESTLPWHLEDTSKRKLRKTVSSRKARKQYGAIENFEDTDGGLAIIFPKGRKENKKHNIWERCIFWFSKLQRKRPSRRNLH